MNTDTIEHKLENPPEKPLNEDFSKLSQAGDEPLPGDADGPRFTKPLKEKKSFKQKLRDLLHSKKFWIITVLILLLGGLAAWFIEPSRYWLVNALGRRTTVTVTVVSPAEEQGQEVAKLKNVKVNIDGRDFTTDDQGKIEVPDQKFGSINIIATKAGYAEVSHRIKLDYDPFFHVLGGKQNDTDARNVQLEMPAVGIEVSFVPIDYLSQKPITTGEFVAADMTLKPNDQGVVSFKAPANDANKVSVKSNFNGIYTDKTFELELGGNEALPITFVPSGRHYFLSNRDGTLGIYGANLDGSEQQQVIPGTGREQADTLFAVNASGTFGVLASTRDGERDAQRQVLVRLYVVDLAKKQLTKVDEGRGMSFIGWQGDTLVYRSTTVSTQPEQALRTLDTSTKKMTELTKAQFMGQGIVALDQVVMSVQEDINKNGIIDYETESTLRRFDIKSAAMRELTKNPVSIMQTDFNKVAFSTSTNIWREYNLNTGDLKDISPPGATSRYYSNVVSPDGAKSLVIDKIDGKFTLLTRSASDGAEKQLYSHGGLGGPLRWLGNDVVVFRVVSSSETADYALSLNGGEPKKISDVTASVYQYDYFNGFRSY